MNWVDLRSDTVTQPTPEMRKAMADAEVGDDVYYEDPTINKLQEMAAERLGKEAGIYLPSGTMGNLLAVLTHCNRGDEVVMGKMSHTFLFEAGGVAALGGVHPSTLPNLRDGTIALEELKGAVRPDNPHMPISKLVIIENTHNRCGGSPLSVEYTRQVAKIARDNDMALHIDGARIFNAAVALGVPVNQLTEPADSVTFCMSKGLCAPVGSILCGSKDFIHKSERIRKALGGGMRQAGIIAAAGIVALEKMVDRLADDHARAKAIADGLAKVPGIIVEYNPPPSNMLFLNLHPDVKQTPAQVAEKLLQYGVKVGVVGSNRFRLVVHYYIDDAGVKRTIDAFSKVL